MTDAGLARVVAASRRVDEVEGGDKHEAGLADLKKGKGEREWGREKGGEEEGGMEKRRVEAGERPPFLSLFLFTCAARSTIWTQRSEDGPQSDMEVLMICAFGERERERERERESGA